MSAIFFCSLYFFCILFCIDFFLSGDLVLIDLIEFLLSFVFLTVSDHQPHLSPNIMLETYTLGTDIYFCFVFSF